MTSKEIISHLEKEGWKFKGQTGSHTKWEHPVTKKVLTVPHPIKDFKKKTLHSIFKMAGWK